MKAGCIIALCGMLFFAADVEARCAKSPRYLTKEYLQSWEIIAFGIVTDIHEDLSSPHNGYAVLALEGAWQGDPPNPLRVYHSDSVHGIHFEKGGSYLVFASRADHRISASICGPTCRGDACLQHLELLGDPPIRF